MFKGFMNIADRSAVVLSTLCMIHCLVLPIILILLPALTSVAFFSDERFHAWLLYAVIPISVSAVVFGSLRYRNWFVVLVTKMRKKLEN
ncbi:MAG: MerC domain-containing protein [Paraglaciecola sp.]|nr:MerC domain-containing protein [Paraglaciecola sp.]